MNQNLNIRWRVKLFYLILLIGVILAITISGVSLGMTLGDQAEKGDTGAQGSIGKQGPVGPAGPAGKSAFEIANQQRSNNDEPPLPDETVWLASLQGKPGREGARGPQGPPGITAQEKTSLINEVNNAVTVANKVMGDQTILDDRTQTLQESLDDKIQRLTTVINDQIIDELNSLKTQLANKVDKPAPPNGEES